MYNEKEPFKKIKTMANAKNVLIILSENFVDKQREEEYLLSARDIISKEGKIPVKVAFHNKKTDNPKGLKVEISKKPDAILFDRCGKATIKKVTSSLCNKIKGKVVIFSFKSDHHVPEVKKIEAMSEVSTFLTN